MCRDSALLLSIFATLLGLPAVICEGQAAIFGPTVVQTMGQLFFETHAWLDIKGYGLCDFSPDLSQGGGPGWSQMPAAYLCGSLYRPRGQGAFDYVVDDESQFKLLVDRRMASAPAFHVIYMEQLRRKFDLSLLVMSGDFAQSTLLESLRAKPYFDPDILIKAALHLWRFRKGEAKTLTAMSQGQAWDLIGTTGSDALKKFKTLLAQRLEAVWASS